jgi:hypothetical protein
MRWYLAQNNFSLNTVSAKTQNTAWRKAVTKKLYESPLAERVRSCPEKGAK